ncbi:DNA damage-binding protein CMR1 [Smittium mucronatum]|uniref:DNA damage-binding protein CMR1 n=2 Tax=Smittium mucronatum TaxID=133383 RepID=A0A1R0H6P0_9FUNG|nr:DNA damage-binding protein CMR1 [Smittium mucronatum]
MSEYEKSRLENIRKNEEMLKSLGLDLGKSKKRKSLESKKNSTGASKKHTTSRKKTVVHEQPTRQSSRIKGIKAKAPELDLERAEKLISSRTNRSYGPKTISGVKSLVVNGDANENEEVSKNENDIKYFKLVAEKFSKTSTESDETRVKSENEAKSEEADENIEKYKTSTIVESSGRISNVLEQAEKLALERIFSDMEIRNEEGSVGVVSSRIYSMAIHPSKDLSSILVCAGSKMGSLGFWSAQRSEYRIKDWKSIYNDTLKEMMEDPDEKSDQDIKPKASKLDHLKEEKEDLEEASKSISDPESNRFSFEPHSDVVSTVLIPQQQQNMVYTSGYDGKVLCLDLNHPTIFNKVMNLNEDPKIISIDLQYQSNSETSKNPIIWFSTFSGYGGFSDSRVPGGVVHEFKSHESRSGCISVNPVYKNIIVTSSLDRTVKVWDVRKMNYFVDESFQKLGINGVKRKKDSTEPAKENTSGLEFDPTLADSISEGGCVTSAYFSPDGNRIATASFNDLVSIYSFNGKTSKITDKQFARHNNKTGR